MAYAQARSGAIQAGATVAALIATAIAALFAWRATHWARKAAEHTEGAVKLALAEARPWVAISPIPKGIQFAPLGSVTFHMDIEFSNVGKTIAADFCYAQSVGFVGDGEGDDMARHRERAPGCRAIGRQALFPGEAWTHSGFAMKSGMFIPWIKHEGRADVAYPVLFVTAYYREAGSEAWLMTERFYKISLKGVEGVGGGIPKDQNLGGEDIVMVSASGNQTS